MDLGSDTKETDEAIKKTQLYVRKFVLSPLSKPFLFRFLPVHDLQNLCVAIASSSSQDAVEDSSKGPVENSRVLYVNGQKIPVCVDSEPTYSSTSSCYPRRKSACGGLILNQYRVFKPSKLSYLFPLFFPKLVKARKKTANLFIRMCAGLNHLDFLKDEKPQSLSYKRLMPENVLLAIFKNMSSRGFGEEKAQFPRIQARLVSYLTRFPKKTQTTQKNVDSRKKQTTQKDVDLQDNLGKIEDFFLKLFPEQDSEIQEDLKKKLELTEALYELLQMRIKNFFPIPLAAFISHSESENCQDKLDQVRAQETHPEEGALQDLLEKVECHLQLWDSNEPKYIARYQIINLDQSREIIDLFTKWKKHKQAIDRIKQVAVFTSAVKQFKSRVTLQNSMSDELQKEQERLEKRLEELTDDSLPNIVFFNPVRRILDETGKRLDALASS